MAQDKDSKTVTLLTWDHQEVTIGIKTFELIKKWNPSAMQDRLAEQYQKYCIETESIETHQSIYLLVTSETVTVENISKLEKNDQIMAVQIFKDNKFPVLIRAEDGQYLIGIVNRIWNATPEVEARQRKKEFIQWSQPQELNDLDDWLEQLGEPLGLSLYD